MWPSPPRAEILPSGTAVVDGTAKPGGRGGRVKEAIGGRELRTHREAEKERREEKVRGGLAGVLGRETSVSFAAHLASHRPPGRQARK